MRRAGGIRAAAAAALGLGLLLPGADPHASASNRRPAVHTVTIDSTRFEPAELSVRAGDTIVWVNKDVIPHTATSKAGAFDSTVIDSGKSWKYTPSKKGTFPYVCAFHPTMKGVLRVKDKEEG